MSKTPWKQNERTIKVRLVVTLVHPKTKKLESRWKDVNLLRVPHVGWNISVGGSPGLITTPRVEEVVLHEGGAVVL